MRFIIMLLFIQNVTFSQTVKEVLTKLNANYADSKNLQFSTKYNLYKTATSKDVYESYSGLFRKSDKSNYYVKISNTEIINTDKLNIKITPEEKIILATDPTTFNLGEFDIKQFLEFCDIKSFVNYKNYWRLTLTSKAFSSLSYSKIVVDIGKDYFIKRQEFFYNTGIDFSQDYRNQDINYPRIEIVYSNYNRNKVDSSLFKTDKYIILKNTKILSKLDKYEIIDQRQIQTK